MKYRKLFAFLATIVCFIAINTNAKADSLNDVNKNVAKIANEQNFHSLAQDKLKNENVKKDVPILKNGTVKIHNNFNATSSHYSAYTFLAEIPDTVVKFHTSQEYVDGQFKINFYIDSITGPAPAAISVQLQFYSEPSLSGPITTNTASPIVKEGNITTGLLGSAVFPAATTFFAVGGAWGMVGYNGNSATYPISLSSIYLQNKIGQNFLEYVDPVSKKDAETPINTTWSRLPSSPVWTTMDRYYYIKEFSERYGNQSKEYWAENQVHHIRPRIYGGNNDFDNLMPVPIEAHKLITKWFINY